MRRAGKTTLLYQIIDFLLQKKEVDHFNILYFSFDEHLKPLIKFMKRFKCEAAVVISKDDERIEKIDELEVTILPYWRYWSIISEIKGTIAIEDGP